MGGVMLSANLCAVAGVEERKVHEGEVDEGKIRWEPPTFAGLTNSTAVDAGTHWYKEPQATPSTAAAMSAQPALKVDWNAKGSLDLKPGANGQIDWAAMA